MNSRKTLRTRTTLGAVFISLLALTLQAPPAHATGSPNLVISQVYGGGGNAGATYIRDFVEILNRGSSTVSLAGMSIQYASSAGSSWSVTTLTGSIPAGGYYLV